MKRFGVLCALAASFLGLGTSSASAAGCTPTGFIRDGMNLTAAQIGGAVTGPLNATGCNIGVYYDSSSGNVTGADIYGANYFGVVVNGDVGTVSVNVTDSWIHDIGESPFNGTQHGVAVYYRGLADGTATGTVDGNTIWNYQKGGITVNGAGATVGVTDNAVTGLGQVDFIAQNGVQFGFGSNGFARGNSISDNFYTGTAGVGPNPGGQNPPGWQYVSVGLLLYQPGDVKHSMNKYSGNQHNVLVAN